MPICWCRASVFEPLMPSSEIRFERALARGRLVTSRPDQVCSHPLA